MLNNTHQQLIKNGLWTNNPALVQLLGLCPLMATTTSLINGLAMGLSTLLVLLLSSVIVGLIKQWIEKSLRLISFMFIIAGSVTLIELIMKIQFYALYTKLGLFIPLIVTNCMIVARVEAFSSKQSVKNTIIDAIFMGLGFMWVLIIIGGLREILSKGSLLSGANTLFGEQANNWGIQILTPNATLIGYLPVGTFILFGLLLAIKQQIDHKGKT